MRIKFCGAARTVTGSQHLLAVDGKRILLDCGLFQGRREEARQKNKSFHYDPSGIDTLVLSHAHIDHCGNIPNLVKQGFAGNVHATRATVDLCNVMLRDSAYLQERDVEWLRRKKHENVEPLYTMEDAERALQQFVGMAYDRPSNLTPNVQVTFRDAGHILGSASVTLDILERGRHLRCAFSGDWGRPNAPILRDPDYLDDLEVLIMESTYGDKLHADFADLADALAETVNKVYQRGGKIIVPAFSVGRTQALVYYLHRLWQENRIPPIPIFVDSPLSVNTTEVFRLHPECFDRETYRIFLKDGLDPFGFERLTYVRDVESSKKLNDIKTPCMIIASSGMAEAGRILHHLAHNVGDPQNCVLIMGFMAEHTLGRRLAEGETEVKILGDLYERRCEVKKLDGLSAHADRNELLLLVQRQNPQKLKHIFLVHGEPEQSEPLAQRIRALGFQNVHVPFEGEEFEV